MEEVERLFTEGGWHFWARVTGFRIADQITGTIGNGLFLEMRAADDMEIPSLRCSAAVCS